MRVLLIHPPPYKDLNLVRQGRCIIRAKPGFRMEFPVFLAYVASMLRENRHATSVIDAVAENITIDCIKQKIEKCDPGAIVVETVPSTYRGDIHVADLAKSIDPKIITVFYGWQSTARPDDVLANRNIDFAIRGEPEYTVLELLDALENGIDVSKIEGISYKKHKKVRHNPLRPLTDDLDELPVPARDLFPVEKYVAVPFGQITTVVASRGCPFRCIFCASHLMSRNQVRLRHPINVANEIEDIVDKFNTKTIFFYADTFTLWNDKNIIAFCNELLERKLNIRWLINSRVDTLPSENILRYMEKAGCFMIQFGVESASLKMIEIMKKGRNKMECERYVKAIKPAIARTRKAHIFTKANTLIGFPGENEETIGESAKLLKSCKIDFPMQIGVPIPFPGSLMGKFLEQKGLFPQDEKGVIVDSIEAWQLYAIAHNIKPERISKLRLFAANEMKVSQIKKVALCARVIAYIARKGYFDAIRNAGITAFKENMNIAKIVDEFSG